MELEKLLSTTPVRSLRIGSGRAKNPEITSLAYDSRQVVDGSLFFAIEGEVTDGHRFIQQASGKGALAVASERDPDAAYDGTWVKFEFEKVEMKAPFWAIVDRRLAIKRAFELARPGDVVLVAGKGHETYQIIKGRKTHFDDREVIKEFA